MLGEMVSWIMPTFDENPDSRRVAFLICKILYSTNQYQLCHYLMQPGCLDPWIEFLKANMERQLPFDCETFNENDQNKVMEIEKRVEWKIKGVAAKLSYRLFVKNGSLSTRADV